jgi:ubiquinone/menaquinone biosynthesis C-methylase UbiE
VGSVYVLHNIKPNREKALYEMIRVLKLGCILAIIEVGGIWYWLKYNVKKQLIQDNLVSYISKKRCLLSKVIIFKKR